MIFVKNTHSINTDLFKILSFVIFIFLQIKKSMAYNIVICVSVVAASPFGFKPDITHSIKKKSRIRLSMHIYLIFNCKF